MKLIVGLGNPGKEYLHTRHNVGFMVADAIAITHSVSFSFKKDFEADITQIHIDNIDAILAKPRTFMNNSGTAVRTIAHFYKISPEDITIIYDDLDTAFGITRYISALQESGSGGHNGIKSITEELGTAKFARIKLGIKNEIVDNARDSTTKEEKEGKIEHFVLSPFTQEESTALQAQIEDIVHSLPQYLK